MSAARRSLVLVPWIVCLALCRVLAGPASELGPFDETPASTRAAVADECGAHGCGCPHEMPAASCCCVEDAPFAPIARPAPPMPEPRSPARWVASRDELPAATLTALHCAGGGVPRTHASRAPTPHAATTASTLVTPEEPGGWIEPVERGPHFDIDREPSTPPPRLRG